MAKTDFLQIRLTPEDRDRVRAAAEAEYLDASTWARRVILEELDRREQGAAKPERTSSASDHPRPDPSRG